MNAEPAPKTAGPRVVRAPRGKSLNCGSWLTEAPFRMLQNNLDPEVAEHPDRLVVYGGIGKAARNWEAFDTILSVLKRLKDDESLLVQSGKPVGVFRTHVDAPRVLIANSNLVPHWATWEHFHELDRKGLMMYGQMTAGSWIYIGSQGIVQGTYETFGACARTHFNGDPRGRWILTGGLGGMGGAQPLAATMAGFSMLAVECDESRIDFRLRTGYVDRKATTLDDALALIDDARRAKKALSVGLLGNAADVFPGARAAQGRAGRRDRPDLRARSAQRLPAARLDARAGGRGEAQRSGAHRARSARVDEDPRAGDAGPQGAGRDHLRLRQQHPPGRARRGPHQRLRLPGLRAGLHPPALLRGDRAVPLGRALGRSGRHLQDRREGAGADAGGCAPAPLARHGARAHQVPGTAGAHLLGRPQGPRAARPRLQRDGREAASSRRRS